MPPIPTPRLTLLPLNVPTYEALFEGSARLAQHLAIQVPDLLSEFGDESFQYSYHKLVTDSSEGPWWLYLFIHTDQRALIGVGGYKGKPDETGMVEIGYEIYESYRNQGLATEAARGLIAWAFDQPAVHIVQAHTLAQNNASVAVLKKCGMTFMEEFHDPSDEPLWRWQINAPD